MINVKEIVAIKKTNKQKIKSNDQILQSVLFRKLFSTQLHFCLCNMKTETRSGKILP